MLIFGLIFDTLLKILPILFFLLTYFNPSFWNRFLVNNKTSFFSSTRVQPLNPLSLFFTKTSESLSHDFLTRFFSKNSISAKYLATRIQVSILEYYLIRVIRNSFNIPLVRVAKICLSIHTQIPKVFKKSFRHGSMRNLHINILKSLEKSPTKSYLKISYNNHKSSLLSISTVD